MRRIMQIGAAALLLLSAASTAQQAAPKGAVPGRAAAPAAAPTFVPAVVPGASAVATAGKALGAADLEPWLDGYIPSALRRGDIAGAVVTVVKDGEVILARGYGYADAAKQTPVDLYKTLFRPGSVSKLGTSNNPST
ncbi:serine hydrolase, partial [Sphingomonas sp. 37zxx]|uniref:serine hydrolase n=1 Tax=Sphingomonas sp. 37zxx TaxID=1550073 RepID=UPI00053C07D8